MTLLRHGLAPFLLTLTLFLVACGSAVSEPQAADAGAESDSSPATAPTTAPTEPPPAETDAAAPTANPESTAVPLPTVEAGEDLRPARLRDVTFSWGTDWTRSIIDLNDLLSGGPPRDGIPPLDAPQFIDQEAAADWLDPVEPVVALTIGGDARAYPLQILTWHEIVNDELSGVPVSVTFCPLCNSAITFDRRLNGTVYDFGTSGLLRNSDLVMWDRQTESLWQQFTGEGIVGELAGAQLTFIPSQIISFGNFRDAFPEGIVLSRETGFQRNYGTNPYPGYDRIDSSPFLFDGVVDGRLAAMARVVTLSLESVDVAYPLDLLIEAGVINDTQAGVDLVVFHQFGTASALGSATIADAEDVGATGVFKRALPDQTLTFSSSDGVISDSETGSTWDITGLATAGPLAGTQLERLVAADHFWFSWAAFRPETIIFEGS
jgi:hypothetical protein